MAKQSSGKKKHKAVARYFEWIPIDSPDFAPYMDDLKKGSSVELKTISPERLKWAIVNNLLVEE